MVVPPAFDPSEKGGLEMEAMRMSRLAIALCAAIMLAACQSRVAVHLKLLEDDGTTAASGARMTVRSTGVPRATLIRDVSDKDGYVTLRVPIDQQRTAAIAFMEEIEYRNNVYDMSNLTVAQAFERGERMTVRSLTRRERPLYVQVIDVVGVPAAQAP